MNEHLFFFLLVFYEKRVKKIKLVELEVNSLSYKYLIILWFLAVNRTTILFINQTLFHSKINNRTYISTGTFSSQPTTSHLLPLLLHFDRNTLNTHIHTTLPNLLYIYYLRHLQSTIYLLSTPSKSFEVLMDRPMIDPPNPQLKLTHSCFLIYPSL